MPPAAPVTYARRVGPFSGTMMVVGGIIGAGIFLNPAVVAARVKSVPLILAVWLAGAVVAVIGAFIFGELGARRPEAGGGYAYLREAYGPLPAFLQAWTLLLVISSGAIAAVALTFATYAVSLLALPAGTATPLALGAIVLLTAINIVGSYWTGQWAAGFNNVQMQNWAWQSSGTNLNLLPGTARLACDQLGNGVYVTGASAACGPGYQNGQGTLALLTDFTGVTTDITAGSGAGTFFDGSPTPIPGFSGQLLGTTASIYAIKVYNPFIPLGLDSTFNSQAVPGPAAVWLFGSAIGILGLARRKSATA